MQFRDATAQDAEGVAQLHADSWRRHYRGAYSDAYLDGDVVADRRAVWAERLAAPASDRSTIVVELDGRLIGFVHTRFDDDPKWGSLLDNLHVTHELQRSGLGTLLMAASARSVLECAASPSLYLWVLEPNTRAQAFYGARGGTCAGREERTSPSGDDIVALRYVWPDAATLLG